MHILLARRAYNYNPTASASVYVQISYTRSGKTYLLRYTLPNAAVSISSIYESLTDGDVTNNKSFIGTADPKGLYTDIGIDETSYEYTFFYTNGSDSLNSVKVSWISSDASLYLPLHMGFVNVLPSSSSTVEKDDTAGDLYLSYWGSYRLPMNVDTGVSRGGSTIISQVSSDWESLQTSTSGGSDITPLGIYNSYKYTVRGKKVKLVNFPYLKLKGFDNFLEFISEDDTPVNINSTLCLMLFDLSYPLTVRIDVENSGDTSVIHTQENLMEVSLDIYHTTNFR